MPTLEGALFGRLAQLARAPVLQAGGRKVHEGSIPSPSSLNKEEKDGSRSSDNYFDFYYGAGLSVRHQPVEGEKGMKRFVIAIIAIIMMLSVPVTMFAQSDNYFTVASWVSLSGFASANAQLRTTAQRELVHTFENSSLWNLKSNGTEWDSDIHVMIYMEEVANSDKIAVSITVAPMFAPSWVNAKVMVIPHSAPGVVYAARSAVSFIEEMLTNIYEASSTAPNAPDRGGALTNS